MIRGKEIFTCRRVLWFFLFTGCIINYMLKISLNLVIMKMLVPKGAHEALQSAIELRKANASNANITLPPITLKTLYPNHFDWSGNEQGMALGSFFWSYWITQIPGGLLSQRYGTKIIFGGGHLAAAIVGIFLPFAVKYHLNAFLALRVLQGAIMGAITPSMHVMTAKWIPPNKRGKFNSCYMGGSIGTTLSYLLNAAITSYYNWQASFYVMSGICFVWFFFWTYFVYDTPQQHPRISTAELNKIVKELSTNSSNHDQDNSIPWRSIITSVPFWVTVIAHWSATWGFYTLLVQGPTYFTTIHQFSLLGTSLITGAPHLLLMAFSCFFGAICDFILKRNVMSQTNVRKLAVSMCTVIQGVAVVGLSLCGSNYIFSCILFIIGTIMSGAISSGSVTIFVDLSSNYGSILFGIAGLFANIATAISPAIVGKLTNNNQTLHQWRLVFMIAAANLIIGGIIFIIWGTAKEQPWNNSKKSDTEYGQELQNLTADNKLSKEKELTKEKETTTDS